MEITRIIGVLEPGGAQLSMLRLALAQQDLGVETTLVAGDATVPGIALARQFGFEPIVFAEHESIGLAPRQWTADREFAEWVGPLLADAELVHAHMFGAWWAAAVAAPEVPVIASEHNAVNWPLGDHSRAATEAAQRVALLFSHGPASRSFAAQIGVPDHLVRPGRSAILSAAQPHPGLPTPRVTFTGRFREDKGPDVLLRAIALLDSPPATYLVGHGPMEQELRQLVRELALGEIVQMPGWSYEPARYVAGASVHVVPSREEAWSQSAVTALALGVPVIGAAVEGLPVTLGDGRGLLVPPEDPQALADGIVAILAGEVTTDVAAGRRYASKFDPAEVAAEYLESYEAVLKGRLPATRSSPVVI